MKAVSGRELARALERHGWSCMRVHGSHHIYGKTDETVRLSVPVHGNRPLKTGLLQLLLKMAGLSQADL